MLEDCVHLRDVATMVGSWAVCLNAAGWILFREPFHRLFMTGHDTCRALPHRLSNRPLDAGTDLCSESCRVMRRDSSALLHEPQRSRGREHAIPLNLEPALQPALHTIRGTVRAAFHAQPNHRG